MYHRVSVWAGACVFALMRGSTAIAAASPSVVSLVPSAASVESGDSLSLLVEYDSDMDGGIAPTLTFPTVGEDASAFLNAAGSRWIDARHFLQNFSVGLFAAAVPNVDVSVDGARDTFGNPQGAALLADVFSYVLPISTKATAVTANGLA